MVLLGCSAVDFNDESCDTAFIAGRIESPYALSNCVVICRGSWQTIRSGHFSILSYCCCCCCCGLFSTTTWVSRDWKGKTSLDLNEARDDGVWGMQWHQLDHMQTICTSFQTDNHVPYRPGDAQPSVSKHNSHYIPQKQQLRGEVTVVLRRNAVALKRVVGD